MNHATQTILGTLVIIVFVMGALFLYEQSERNQAVEDTSTVPEVPVNETPKESIEEYISKNISTFSTEPAQLGGTFYVTSIEAKDGSGMVSYEDGHNAYIADFTYTSDPLSVTSFVIRSQ